MRLDGRDIFNKLNEFGVDGPIFVAKDVSKLPLATPDAFDLAKISRNINDVIKVEENVMSSFTALSCMQNDNTHSHLMSKLDVLSVDIIDNRQS